MLFPAGIGAAGGLDTGSRTPSSFTGPERGGRSPEKEDNIGSEGSDPTFFASEKRPGAGNPSAGDAVGTTSQTISLAEGRSFNIEEAAAPFCFSSHRKGKWKSSLGKQALCSDQAVVVESPV